MQSALSFLEATVRAMCHSLRSLDFRRSFQSNTTVSVRLMDSQTSGFLTNALNHSSHKIMTQLYCNALHVWLSISLQPITTLFSLVVR